MSRFFIIIIVIIILEKVRKRGEIRSGAKEDIGENMRSNDLIKGEIIEKECVFEEDVYNIEEDDFPFLLLFVNT